MSGKVRCCASSFTISKDKAGWQQPIIFLHPNPTASNPVLIRSIHQFFALLYTTCVLRIQNPCTGVFTYPSLNPSLPLSCAFHHHLQSVVSGFKSSSNRRCRILAVSSSAAVLRFVQDAKTLGGELYMYTVSWIIHRSSLLHWDMMK